MAHRLQDGKLVHDRRRFSFSVQRSVGPSGHGVGKRTLTEELEAVDPEPVQREGESPQAAAEVHSAAARGTALPTTAMPHGERIKSLFGPPKK